MGKQLIKILLAMNTVCMRVLEPIKQKPKGFYICERYDLKK